MQSSPNVLKHNKAKNLYVSTETKKHPENFHEIIILIRDDGRWTDESDRTSRGLKNMKKRTNSINAKLDIVSSEDGTCIEIVLSGNKKMK